MPSQKHLLTLFTPSIILSLAWSLPHAASSRFMSLADVPTGPRQEHSTVYLAPDTIAVIGGVIPDANASVAPFSSTTQVELYSIREDAWHSAAPIPGALNHPNSAAVDGKIYVFGGLDNGGETREFLRATNDSWMYDLTTDTWSPISPNPVARGASAVTAHREKIYVIGGFSELYIPSQSPQDASYDLVTVYDTSTQTWITDSLPENAKHIPGRRDHAQSAIVDEKLYVIGGFNFGGFNQSDTVFILDLQNPEAGWETSAARMPTPRASFGIGVHGTQIYTIGGEGNATADAFFPFRVFDEVEVYDTVADSWIQLEPIPYERQGMGVGIKGKLYLPCGADRQPVGPISRFDAYLME